MYFRQRLMPILHRPAVVVAPPSGDPDLYTNLTAFWPMDEASGTRADAHTNEIDLTDNFSTGSATGLVYSNAANFVSANTNFLSHAEETDLQPIGDFSLVVWFYPTVDEGNWVIAFKGYGGFWDKWTLTGQFEASKIRWGVANSGDTFTNVNSTSDYNINAWNLAIGRYTHSSEEVALKLNDDAWSTATLSGDIGSTPGVPFRFGGIPHFDGRIGPAGFWGEALSDEKSEWLYNSGAGRTYAEIAATAP